MGADLLLTWVELPEGSYTAGDGSWPTIVDADKVGDVLYGRAKEVPAEKIYEINDAWILDLIDSIIDCTDIDPDDFFMKPLAPEASKALLDGFADRVRMAWDNATTDLRSTQVLRVGGGRPVIMTGGTSWGDSPSDVWDDVILLSESGVMDDPMPWV